jgi:hypothetical protein
MSWSAVPGLQQGGCQVVDVSWSLAARLVPAAYYFMESECGLVW